MHKYHLSSNSRSHSKHTRNFEVGIPQSLLKGMSLYLVAIYSNNTPIISINFIIFSLEKEHQNNRSIRIFKYSVQ